MESFEVESFEVESLEVESLGSDDDLEMVANQWLGIKITHLEENSFSRIKKYQKCTEECCC